MLYPTELQYRIVEPGLEPGFIEPESIALPIRLFNSPLRFIRLQHTEGRIASRTGRVITPDR